MTELVAAPVRTSLRNVAIVAHVDHGKTTLVDAMLKQSNVFRQNAQVGTLLMDSNELERERGITILAKNTSVEFRGVTVNIIDTPGHADFGGEVERVLNMADGCLLLVDAVEGPMPQTRFVLRKAFEMGLPAIVVINKIDRPMARPAEVLREVEHLFLELATDDAQLDFPVLYTNAREGTASLDPAVPGSDLRPLFEAIIEHVPPPTGDVDAPLQMLIAALDYDSHRGRLAIGRVERGRLEAAARVARVGRAGVAEEAKVTGLFLFSGLTRRPVDEAHAGDIVVVSGLESPAIGDTIADIDHPEPLGWTHIQEPTVQMTFSVNSSPFAGREGKYCTSREIRRRLFSELDTNVALRVDETEGADRFLVSGRGELHLAILIETMRREGYEFEVSRPRVITREVGGVLCEPYEHVTILAREEHAGFIVEQLGTRGGAMRDMVHDGLGGLRIEYEAPTRGLFGFRGLFLSGTRGEGQLSNVFLEYRPWAGEFRKARNGVLVAHEGGVAVTYGLSRAQQRGATFVEPGTNVYRGMIVGLNTRDSDIPVNVCKQKEQTNIRSSTSDIAIRLTPAVIMSLEECLDFIEDDELLEVTPLSLRMRKRE